jgi:predicted TIM-barrel fold metal-dependent hydrolase
MSVTSGVDLSTRESTQELDLHIPEPEPREVKYTVISVDDHVVEPAHTFEGRLPRHLQDRAPRLVTSADGEQSWHFDGGVIPHGGLSAFAGRRFGSFRQADIQHFDEMRPGCYDIHARVADMNVNGVWASLNFPSHTTGFCGRIYSGCSDRELGYATTRAWNDWLYEEWYLAYPERIIPNALTFIADADLAAEEIRRNADRGFKAVTMPERPHRIGLPSIFDDYWDPVMRACVDTDTIVCLHVGSTGMLDLPENSPKSVLDASMFSAMSLWACLEWLWSPYPRRYPELKIAMSEGGIGWTSMLIERIQKMNRRGWYGSDPGVGWSSDPADVLRNQFWFCTIDDYSAIASRDTIGTGHIMVEVDYPHIDSTWPDTQGVIEKLMAGVPPTEVRAMCSENAAALFRHPLPETVLPLG